KSLSSVHLRLFASVASSLRFASLCCLFDDPATSKINTLSLHDALPILFEFLIRGAIGQIAHAINDVFGEIVPGGVFNRFSARKRSEEHTSELQSRENLVCRLLLEKKKIQSKKTSQHRAEMIRTSIEPIT